MYVIISIFLCLVLPTRIRVADSNMGLGESQLNGLHERHREVI